MPVARKAADAPDWCRFSAFGVFERTEVTAPDYHFHDADEYWLVCAGRAIVRSEDIDYEVGPGDILFTKMGDYHAVVKVLEAPFRAFFVEDELKGRKRRGHLHQEDE